MELSYNEIEEFKLSKKTKHNESTNVNLKVPKTPPKTLFANPKNTILRTLVNPFAITEIRKIINKKVNANDAIFM